MTSPAIKKIIHDLLEQNDLDAVASFVQRNKKALSQLIRMAYDKDTLEGWRAIKAIGRASRTLVKTDDEFLRVTIRKLLWSLTDESGGIGWSAPEILGEIVSADPDKFSDIIPLIAGVYEIEEKVFRPGVVYALAGIAESAPERVACFQKIIIMALTDDNALVKVNVLDLVGKLWKISIDGKVWNNEYAERVRNALIYLKNDCGVAIIYKNNGFIDIQVGEMALNVLAQITE